MNSSRHGDAVVDGRHGAAEARQQAALLGGVRLRRLVIVAMLEADVHADALGGEGEVMP